MGTTASAELCELQMRMMAIGAKVRRRVPISATHLPTYHPKPPQRATGPPLPIDKPGLGPLTSPAFGPLTSPIRRAAFGRGGQGGAGRERPRFAFECAACAAPIAERVHGAMVGAL